MSYAKYKDLGDSGLSAGSSNKSNSTSGSSPPSSVYEIQSQEDKEQLLKSFRVVVNNIHGTFCSPCKQLAPRYEKLAKEMYDPGNIILVKENVELNLTKNIRGVPTFLIYVNGALISSTIGGDFNELQNRIRDAQSMV
jgi:thioredoxin 1